MSRYVPDKWILLETGDGTETVYKVFAGWYGGYTGSDSWKLSSGVTNMTVFPDRYEFENFSGSLYVCYKAVEGMSMYMRQIFDGFMTQLKDVPEFSMSFVNIKDIDSSKYIK